MSRKNIKIIIFVVFLAAPLLLGVILVNQEKTLRSQQPVVGEKSLRPPTPTLRQAFIFGDEYVLPGIADYYSALGTTWSKISDVRWSAIEPKKPVGDVHKYDWSFYDSVIQSYQKAGYVNFHLVLKPDAPWATIQPEKKLPFVNPAYPLKPGFEEYYAQWIADLTERYDYDGVGDMPGLLRPVTSFEIMSEAQHDGGFFVSGELNRTQEYEKILKISYRAIKMANPQASVLLSGITLEGVVDGNPGPQLFFQRLREFPQNQLNFVVESLRMTDYYDEVEIHYLGDWLSAYAFVNWIRDDLKISKPLWAGDAFPIHMIIPSKHPLAPSFYKNGGKLYEAVDRAMLSQFFPKTKTLSQDSDILIWYRREQAQSLMKKAVVAADLDLEGIMMGNTIDWFGWRNSPIHTKSVAWMGLVHARITKDKKFEALEPRLAFIAYQFLIENLNSLISLDRIPVTSQENVYFYKAVKEDNAVVYVGWYDDGVWECPVYCETESEVEALVKVPIGEVNKVYHLNNSGTITKEMIKESQRTSSGIWITLNEMPLLLK